MNYKAVLLSLAMALAWPAMADTDRYQQWLEEMREQPRGPFSRIRWFCNDGTVLPPKAYACRPHGGGIQHGEWSARTLEMRDQGYLIANLLAGIQPDQALADPGFENLYAQILIEKFLVAMDDGWIFRRALSYRGAIQEEDERAYARLLLLEMLSREQWLGSHYTALRTGVRMLPHGTDTASTGLVRELSASLSEDDRTFMPIRIKIHGSPDSSDAARVQEYLESVQDPALRARYERLVEEIDKIYQAPPLQEQLAGLAGQAWLPQNLRTLAREAAGAWEQADAPARLSISGQLMAAMRDELPAVRKPTHRLQLTDFSLQVEAAHFRASTTVRSQLPGMTRGQILAALSAAGEAAYGAGLLNARLNNSLQTELAGLQSNSVNIAGYQKSLAYLNRVPQWAIQAMRRSFYPPMMKLAEVEPLAQFFIQSQLRGSPLLFYSQSLNLLAADAGNLAGIRHQLFGSDIGTGFVALNPGLARGILHVRPPLDHTESLNAKGIYLLPETVAELPPVAGILTSGAGNPLSHVQLLARNLGIPNVSVGPRVVRELAKHDASPIVLAVSPGGLIEIEKDSAKWNPVFDQGDKSTGTKIVPDLDKLDLTLNRVVGLETLSAEDSGRTVGPKAAKLAELHKHYPEAVSRGVAIPFGVFKAVALDQPHPSGGTVFQWMQRGYAHLATMPVNSAERAQQTEVFREELYQLIVNTRLTPEFVASLRQGIAEVFGTETAGLFVRSDTNVEDLAGFTGAGLNLTLPNVVGMEQLLDSIPRVWASPFTSRAFSWRQSHMTKPEHVYTSILLLESVGSDKSGVLVTADIDSGDPAVLSVAVNEGLGGAVDGQAAESLRIPLDGGPVRVLATATAPTRRLLADSGGIIEVPSSGNDYVLSEQDIRQLIAFANSLPQRFPNIKDDSGKAAPADVEFGFLDGRLRLFQLRPFLDSSSVARNSYLQQMDARGSKKLGKKVKMNEVPDIE